MKKNLFLSFITFLCLLSCGNDKLDPCLSNTYVFALTVDYTTNDFLGSYVLDLPATDSVEFTCDYKSPSDFGEVTWFDKKTKTNLFSGTIIWMGKGERTFPEKIEKPSSYGKLEKPTPMPTLIPLYHDEYQYKDPDVDYKLIWDAVKYQQNSAWAQMSVPAYIYLYQPSVGAGDPKDWYWIIFLTS